MNIQCAMVVSEMCHFKDQRDFLVSNLMGSDFIETLFNKITLITA